MSLADRDQPSRAGWTTISCWRRCEPPSDAANVAVDPDVTAAYSRDMMPLAPSGTPLAVVFPTDTDQVAAVVRACAAAGVPIVPRGAGSGLTGAANARRRRGVTW